MKIAVGNSRMDKRWKNREISWDDFLQRVGAPIRTSETVSECATMPKNKRDGIKDVGGFVGGHLKEGKRKNGFVLVRELLTLDADYAQPGFWDELTAQTDYRCCVYSTHKHTPKQPRLRLIIPLAHEVSEDEYPALGRMVARDVGLDSFDDTTYEPARLMYWPSTPSDGEFVFRHRDGPLLDPDEYLRRYKDWRDVSTWPVSSRQSEVVKRTLKQQADPLTKPGVVGAFCRAYSIEGAIDHFLSDVYEPSAMDGRYDYTHADSTAGVVIYDGKFAYSHHATDPAHGKLMNAFDLVRAHCFRELDDNAAPDTPIGKLPSFKAMTELAIADEQVKLQLAEERQAAAKVEFDPANAENWQSELEIDKRGNVLDTLSNIVLILRHDEYLQGIAFNRHRDGIDVRGGIPWDQIKPGWSDADFSALKVYLHNHYGLYTPAKTKDAVLAVAAERAYHPIRDFLDTLPEWDGIPRVEMLLVDYFGAEDSGYTRAVMRKTLAAAVARVYEPGTKFDSILILNGPQGIGKSTFFFRLAGDWFSDSLTLTEMRDKAGAEKLQGYWILELGELAGMRKADVETVKSFVSRTDDKYRASYGVNVESHPRQCVIVGSTNSEGGFLRDITGNRRFWPVRTPGDGGKRAWQLVKVDVDQIWAEALVIYRGGEKLYLEGEDERAASANQADAMESDDREGLVRVYLDTPLPENWAAMPLYERRTFLGGDEFGSPVHGALKQRELVCNMEIWCECLGKDAASMKKADSYEISAIMGRIEGWGKYGLGTGRYRFPIYGHQRAYARVATG